MTPSRSSHLPLHPEYPAAVAARARKLGRFWISIDAPGGPKPDKRRRKTRSKAERKIKPAEFDTTFGLVLDAMRECRIFGLPTSSRGREARVEQWLEKYTRRDKRVVDVDVKAKGVRDDLEVWRWLVENAQPIISCDAKRLDTATLFSVGSGPWFMTVRLRLSTTALAFAKKQARQRGTVALVPMHEQINVAWKRAGAPLSAWSMVVVAAPELAAELAADSLCEIPATDEERLSALDVNVGILELDEATSVWAGRVSERRFEKDVCSILQRGLKYPRIAGDAARALAAAEGVAITLGRGPVVSDDGMDKLIHEFVIERSSKADPVNDETIDLAIRAVKAVASAGVCERAKWETTEARAAFRAEVDGLRKRLEAARRSRGVRSNAANAAPSSPFREMPLRPSHWRTTFLHILLDDAIALLGAIRDRTGATPVMLMSDLSLTVLASDWDVRQELGTTWNASFDKRPDVEDELSRGKLVYLWWDDIGPRPSAYESGEDINVMSWGTIELLLMGATKKRVLRSELKIPTGRELGESKFKNDGPWKEVDWAALRKKGSAINKLLAELGAVAPLDIKRTLTLPAAAASSRRKKRVLEGERSYWKVELPPE